MGTRDRNLILIGLWAFAFYAFAAWIVPFQKNILAWPSASIQIEQQDADSWLRLTQVKQWIQHPDFFNHNVENTNTPYGGIETPWTRPMHAVLLLPYFFMPNDMPLDQRLMLSATWMPVLLGLLTIILLIKTSAGHFRNVERTAIILLCFLFNPFVSLHFSPGDADHHSLQALLFCGALYLLTRPHTRPHAIALGVITGLSIWVSVEAFIIFPFIYALLCFQTLHQKTSFAYLTWASWSATAIAMCGLLIEVPADHILTHVKYDTLSAPYVTALFLGACGINALYYLTSKIKNPCHFYQSGYALIMIIGAILSTVLYALFPDIIKGPFAGLDIHYLTTVFLPSAAEATPLLKNDKSLIVIILALPCITTFLSIFFLKKSPVLWGIFFLTLAMTLNQTRWFYYLEPISIVLIAKYLPIFIRHYQKGFSFKIRSHYCSIPIIIFFLALPKILSPFTHEEAQTEISSYQIKLAKCSDDIFFNIQNGNLVKKIGNDPINIETNITKQSSALLFFTPYKIITAHYHREIESEKQWNILFSTPDPDVASTILKERQINYLIVCPDDTSWLRGYQNTAPKTDALNWVENLGNLPAAPKDQSFPHQPPVLLKINTGI